MYPGGHVLIGIALRTTVIYAVVLLGMRLSGKREVGQMTPFDLTLLLLLSNAVQNAMTGPDTSVLGGIVAASTLLLLNYGISGLPEVALAVREVDGSISCVKYDDIKPTASIHLSRRKILQKHQ
jgi:uncharacterized membrane protein YcaP (DUF421 family)